MCCLSVNQSRSIVQENSFLIVRPLYFCKCKQNYTSTRIYLFLVLIYLIIQLSSAVYSYLSIYLSIQKNIHVLIYSRS